MWDIYAIVYTIAPECFRGIASTEPNYKSWFVCYGVSETIPSIAHFLYKNQYFRGVFLNILPSWSWNVLNFVLKFLWSRGNTFLIKIWTLLVFCFWIRKFTQSRLLYFISFCLNSCVLKVYHEFIEMSAKSALFSKEFWENSSMYKENLLYIRENYNTQGSLGMIILSLTLTPIFFHFSAKGPNWICESYEAEWVLVAIVRTRLCRSVGLWIYNWQT